MIDIDSFREKFAGYEDCYTIIGGTACAILMNEAGQDFRVTRDIDMILLVEGRFVEFVSLFWEYIRDGEYRCGWKNSNAPHFYRFTEPRKPGFPVMIELFSRRPAFQFNRPDIHLTPLPISDEISSLSAIMLDDDYYALVQNGRKIADGISVLQPEYLMLFKIKAWLDLRRQKEAEIHVNSKDLRKHKNDIFRLFTIANQNIRIEAPPAVKSDVNRFVSEIVKESIDLRAIGVNGVSIDEVLSFLKKMVET